MAPRQRGFDAALARVQPVHGGVDVVGGGTLHAKVFGQRGVGPPAGGGELGPRAHYARDDHGEREVTLFGWRAQQLGQAELGGHRRDRGDVAVGQAAFDLKGIGGGDKGLAGKRAPNDPDDLFGQVRDVADRLVAHLVPVPVAAAQQVRDVLAALMLAHDARHVHGPGSSRHGPIVPHKPLNQRISLATSRLICIAFRRPSAQPLSERFPIWIWVDRGRLFTGYNQELLRAPLKPSTCSFGPAEAQI